MSRRSDWASVALIQRIAARRFDEAANSWASQGQPEAARSCEKAAESNRVAADSAEWRSRPWYKRLGKRP